MAETEGNAADSTTKGDQISEANGTGTMTEKEQKIIKQMEYYFGDINLARDRFLQAQIKEDNGWVPLEIMIKFNRLKSITEDTAAIAEALLKATSGLLEVSEDKTKIRRVPDRPLPEYTKERKEDLKSRSVYAKGFPLDVSLDEVEQYFSKFGKPEHIQMRRDTKKAFKGSVFVLFSTVEEAKKFMEEKEVKYEDTELVRFFKEDYFKHKSEEKKLKKEEDIRLKDEAKEKKQQEEEKKLEERMTKGAILKLTGLPGEDLARDDIQAIFEKYAKVRWIDFEKGQTEAKLRFFEEGQAKTVLEKAKEAGDGKVMLKDTEIQASVLEGEEELDHWKQIFRDQAEAREAKKRKRGGNRFGGREYSRKPRKQVNPQQAQKKKFDSDEEDESQTGEPPAKQVKTDD